MCGILKKKMQSNMYNIDHLLTESTCLKRPPNLGLIVSIFL